MNSLILDLMAMSAIATVILLIVRIQEIDIYVMSQQRLTETKKKLILSSFAALVGRV